MAVITDLPQEMLEMILEYVSLSDLRSFRISSKHLYQYSTTAWKKFTSVRINDLSGGDSIKSFLEFVTSGANVGLSQPFQNFSLAGYFTGSNVHLLQTFFQKCGSEIKSLNLRQFGALTPQNFREILFTFCVNMRELSYSGDCSEDPIKNFQREQSNTEPLENTNLKTLTIYQPSKCNNGKLSWMDLFSRLPRLKALRLLEFSDFTVAVDIFSAIHFIRNKDPSMLKFTEICIKGAFMPQMPSVISRILNDPDLHLKNVCIQLHDLTQFSDILRRHGKSIKSLEFWGYKRTPLDPSQILGLPDVKAFTVFENLSVLRLNSYLFSSLSFLQFTPNLKTLSTGYCPPCSSTTFPDLWTPDDLLLDIKLSKCTELEMWEYLSPTQIQVLGSWIPNVKTLKMPLDDDSFPEVCKSWPNLIFLDIVRSCVSESGITGLDEQDIAIINGAGGDGCMRPSTVPRASIASLKYLQTVILRYDIEGRRRYQPRRTIMGLCAIKYGFQLVQSLQSVLIDEYEFSVEFWDKLPRQWGRPKYLLQRRDS